MQVKNPATKDELKKRLRRIEGQVRGVEKMIDEDRDCHELLQQLSAIRSAVQQASLLVIRSYASQCLSEPPESESRDEMIEDLITVLGKTT